MSLSNRSPVQTSRMAVVILVIAVLTIQMPCSAAFSTLSSRTSTASGSWGTTIATSCVNHVNEKIGPRTSHNMVTLNNNNHESQEAATLLTAEELQSMTIKALKERIQEQYPNERTSQFRLKKDFVSFLVTQQQHQQDQEVSVHDTSEDTMVVLPEELEQAGKRTRTGKRVLTEEELLKRRKSPALWRFDLANDDTDTAQEGGLTSTIPQQQQVVWKKAELMAPAGGWPQLRAAIANGADAVYLGLQSFSARARASNFHTGDELEEAVQEAHASGVKVYVALNTLFFNAELAEIESLVQQVVEAQVDAVICQDMGGVRLLRTILTDIYRDQDGGHRLEVHASTQQSITSADGARFAAESSRLSDDDQEVQRVVLGRELSVDEMGRISQDIIPSNIETEAFVHGALCVSYSGQCFSSEAWGGRSANRGQCAQACRLPYGLIRNGVLEHLVDQDYLLSPQDLSGLFHVSDLMKAGVACFKIEGRLKDASYVAATTRAYRHAIDTAWDDLVEQHKKQPNANIVLQEGTARRKKLDLQDETVTREELAQVFSRGQDAQHDGLSAGFMDGSHHQRLVRGRSPRHRGVHVGRVAQGSSWRTGLLIETDPNDMEETSPLLKLKRGDGLVVDRGMAQEEELGGSIYNIELEGDNDGLLARVEFGRDVERQWKSHTDDELVPVGAHVWKTSDASVDKKLRRLAEAAPPRSLAQVSVRGALGEPLTITISDGTITGTGVTEGVLTGADNSGLSPKSIQKAVGLLGNTPWSIDPSQIDTSLLDEGLWCPISWVKEARRKAIVSLEEQQDQTNEGSSPLTQNSKQTTSRPNIAEQLLHEARFSETIPSDIKQTKRAHVSVLARTIEQVNILCEMVDEARSGDGCVDTIDEIMIDFLELDGMREAVARVRQTPGITCVVASPRILKPGEEGIWRTLLRLEPDGLLVRSAGLLYRMNTLGGAGTQVDVGNGQVVTIPKLLGDFSLNVANVLTAREFLDAGLERVTAAYDLSANAITELATSMGGANGGAQKLEVVAHTHLPIFHTEHCVFARFLSKGDSYLDCGHVCTRSNIHLRDQSGADNLVLADMGCRNTVFSAEAQSGVHSLDEWTSKDVGIGHLRIELVDEAIVDDIHTIVQGYLDVLGGRQRPSHVWDALQHVRDSNGRAAGVSHGSLRNHAERRAGEL